MIIEALDNQRNNTPKIVPQAPFTMYIVCQKGGGKSTLVINLLKNSEEGYHNKFNRIIWFSPTASMDSKIQILNGYPNILAPNKKLLRKLKPKFNVLDDEESQLVTTMDSDDFMDLDIDFLTELMDNQKKIIESYGKSVADDILLILDDCISSKILNKPEFSKMIFNSRHLKCSIIFVSQSYYSLPKRLRLQNSSLIIFEMFNKKELQSIYSENSQGSMSFERFLELFHHATKEPFSFLQIISVNPKGYRFTRNFEKFINIEVV